MKYLKLFEQLSDELDPFDINNYKKYYEGYIVGDIIDLVGEVDGERLSGSAAILEIDHLVNYCGGIISPYLAEPISSWSGTTILVDLGYDTWYISPYNIRYGKVKRKLNFEDDPLGEENWGFEN